MNHFITENYFYGNESHDVMNNQVYNLLHMTLTRLIYVEGCDVMYKCKEVTHDGRVYDADCIRIQSVIID